MPPAPRGERILCGRSFVRAANAVDRLFCDINYFVTPERAGHVFGMHLQLVVVGASALDQAVQY